MSGAACMPYSVWSSLPASVCQLTKTFVCELDPQLIYWTCESKPIFKRHLLVNKVNFVTDFVFYLQHLLPGWTIFVHVLGLSWRYVIEFG